MKIVITESQYQKLVENIEIIDDILDKLGKIGYENLNNDEKMTLNRYSEWLNSGQKGEFMGEITPKNTDFEAKIGEKFTTNMSDNSELTFTYDYSDILKHENIHYGTVKWHGEEWVGLIATDKNDKITEIDFVLEQDFYLDSDVESFSEYDDSNEKRLQDEIGKDYKRLEYFFQEDVVPFLVD
jgi:hypothetical protein